LLTGLLLSLLVGLSAAAQKRATKGVRP
jgi:hypothetical protein